MNRAILLCLLCIPPAHARARDVFLARLPQAAIAREMLASWYGFESGSKTASGERFDPHALTCAFWNVPFNTMLRVTYQGRALVCRVNDRGPAKWTGRGIDLSLGMARALGMLGAGVGRVTVERL
jgi:rare lipoprotein A